MLSFVAIADYRKARLRAMAAEVATSLAPPQGVAATGGAPSEFTETGAEGKIPGVDRVPPTRKMAKSVSFKHAALCIELAASERRILKISAKLTEKKRIYEEMKRIYEEEFGIGSENKAKRRYLYDHDTTSLGRGVCTSPVAVLAPAPR